MQGDKQRAVLRRLNLASQEITTLLELKTWVKGPLREMIPHEKALVGFGRIGYTRLHLDFVQGVNIADDFIATKAVSANASDLRSPVMTGWHKQRTPQIFVVDEICQDSHEHWCNTLKQHKIKNELFDACVEEGSGHLTFINLLNVSVPLDAGAHFIAGNVTPLLPDIWTRIDSPVITTSETKPAQFDARFTDAERDALRWLREGKTNWEIAQILGKSEFTVKNQIAKMLAKTQLNNRHELCGHSGE